MPICFFIDEIQYMREEELSSLIGAIHRTNQLGYPIMLVGAGLPKIYKMLSDAKSYSERLFWYKEIGTLTKEQAIEAIENPAAKFHVTYSQSAMDEIIRVTKGYPFFIQQFCKIVFDKTSGDQINLEQVSICIEEFFHILDNGFFKVRYERCSEGDKKFLFAMVKCGTLPCIIANIAANLHKDTSTISPTRAQLINKGIIYPVRYRELDFTVPEFDQFVRRLEEYKQWESSGK